MSTKELRTRIQLKNDTAENWKTASDNGFIPKLGEPIFYRTLDTLGYSFKMKIGDNVRTPDDLPFLGSEENIILEYASNTEIDALFA